MDKIRATAVMALYNAEKYVADSIKSVVTQDYPKGLLTLGITNDASTDKSFEVVYNLLDDRQLICNDEEKSVFSGTIQGVKTILVDLLHNGRAGRARNKIIERTIKDTDVYFLCDSDDIQLPGKFKVLTQKWAEYPTEISVVYCDYIINNILGGFQTTEYKAPYSMDLLMKECCVASNCLFSREAVEKGGMFAENEGDLEDYGAWLRYQHFGMIVHVPEALTVMNITGGNSTIRNNDEWRKNHFEILSENYNKFRQRMHL